jgi:uncharacterized membrane protein
VRIEESIEIDRPCELVYALVRDLERAPEWQESLESVDVQMGAEVRKFGGLRHEASFIVQEDDPPRRLVMTSESDPAYVRASFDLRQSGDGTRVDFALELDLRGATRFAGGIVKAAAQREAKANLERLKELAEGTHSAAG